MISARSGTSSRGVLQGAAGVLGGMRAEAKKGYAFIERNIYLTKRYWGWELVWVTYNIINALSVTFIAAAMQKTNPGVHFSTAQISYAVLYLTIGTAIWSLVSVVFDNVTEMVTM